ncbi:MAG TPA: HDIG domain-containing protein, partial [Armatimonadota bacterium]|nr:HDIG domain-containing protein [Armatimonadota bacterium]
LPMPAPQVALVRSVAQFAIRPTRSFSSEKTEQARKRVEALVKPVLAEVLPGEPIIQKGETVTQAHLDKFTALGLRRPRMDWLSGFYVSLFILGMVAIIASYIYCYHRTIYNNWHWLWLLALILIGSMAAFKLGGSALGIKLDTTQYGYFGMFCVSTAAMLIAVLLSPSLAVVIASLLSLHVGIMTNYDLRFTGVALVSSLIGIHSFSHIRDRGDLVRSLLVLCSAGTLAIWVLGSLSGDSTPDLFIGVAWGIGSSMLACLITWLAVALIERPFGITTHFGLLELSDMNQPALRRLLQEAPGTYIHSLNVGQLAEAAAEVCGADPLLARVGAYYHDIGKVMRPYCFVENQTVENIHNRLNPTLSTLVVTSHIKDGIELAREYRLPSVISGVIRSHHGTGLVKYFYHQAMRASDGECPPEHQFRYEGPKPRTKEQGIIMLADSVESAVRAALADRPDPSRIQAIVARIIKDKSADGQLDECDLTFRDLTKLTAAFTRILQGIFHARIKYPEPLTEEGQALNGIGSSTAAEHPESPSDSEGDGDNRHELTAS